jgi:Ca2+/Na+ antiporter
MIFIKITLTVLLLLVCIIPLNGTIRKNQNKIILGLLFITLMSLLYDDVSLTLLLICLSVLFIFNIQRIKLKEKEKITQTSKTNMKTNKYKDTTDDYKNHPIPPIPPSPPLYLNDTQQQQPPSHPNASNAISRHFNNMDSRLENIQSNVFDPVNIALFYNELGDQHNIQGLEKDISGYDRDMFLVDN